jgi:predicted ABC-type ATPase
VSTPVLHVLAGPNGAGKSTFVDKILAPSTRLRFINADLLAAKTWPGEEEGHAYEASSLAAAERQTALLNQRSFITETVFSHASKVDLVQQAVDYGYLVTLHVILVPESVAVSRVGYRVDHGGHAVPEDKIRARYRRLWALVAQARAVAHRAVFYDNSTAAAPFRRIAVYEHGSLVGEASWPSWTPEELL